jgi:hypothetical protein
LKDTTLFGGISLTLIVINVFLPLDHLFRLDNDVFKKDIIVLEGPLRRLSSLEISDMLDNLVLKENGDGFVGYEKKA